MKDKLTAEEIAKKHYPDHKFEECEMSCMQCDNGVCESKDFSRKELTEDIKKLAESDLVSKAELLEWIDVRIDKYEQQLKVYQDVSDFKKSGKLAAFRKVRYHLTQPNEGKLIRTEEKKPGIYGRPESIYKLNQ